MQQRAQRRVVAARIDSGDHLRDPAAWARLAQVAQTFAHLPALARQAATLRRLSSGRVLLKI